MRVVLKWRKLSNGNKSAFLDISNHGVRKRISIEGIIYTSDTKIEAKEKIKLAEKLRNQIHEDLIKGKYDIEDQGKEKQIVLHYCKSFTKTYKKTGKRKYRGAVNKFESYLKNNNKLNLTFVQLTKSYLQDYQEWLLSSESKLSGETPFDYWKRLRSIVKQAVEKGHLKKSPFTGIKFERPADQLKKQILTEEELQKLFRTLCTHPEVRRGFILCAYTGFGRAELLNLRWEHLANDRVNFRRSKKDSPIQFKLHPTAKAVLGPPGKPKDKVFNLPSESTVTKHLKRWITTAKIDKHITFYCGRHSFAIRLLKGGTNLAVLSKLMGHKKTTQTEKYLNYLNELKDDAIDALEALG